ncbi:hypothetical protein EJ08DRAFT_672221 [Tothia fuscella]|uniref:Altered inheritance of mitochondria protein 6 n=1 Tax=Tothia fuscella TaxID=1048955 RepID=A0A9P4NK68_9PEZI|nr:hypothetical protein EJ08DRAFT_672221 [Tothia fuscella]
MLDDRSDLSIRQARPAPQSRRKKLIDYFLRHLDPSAVGKKKALWTRCLVVLAVLTLAFGIACLIWISMVLALIQRLTPVIPHNGLKTILGKWQEPTNATALQVSWLPNFSTGVSPKNIHSHNDYDRDVPLFRALSFGCTGVEADIWLENGDLQVGHTQRNLRPARTLQSLYLNPLMNILSSQNMQNPNVNKSSVPLIGVFNRKPQQSLILMLDFKSDPSQSFPLVVGQLNVFRDAGYLTHWDGTHLINGPITIVASGLASKRIDLVQASNHTIFLDAPLIDLSQSDSPYNSSNSFYASAPLAMAIGGAVPLSGLDAEQKKRVETLVKTAQDKGLKSRFWATTAWPIGLRDRVWKQLVRRNVGMLNVDDVQVAAQWNWNLCVVAGVRLC